jgi:hypothetical protein
MKNQSFSEFIGIKSKNQEIYKTGLKSHLNH